MAGSLGSLVVEIAADTARLRRDMGRASSIVTRDLRKIRRAAQGVTGALGLIGGGLSFGLLTRSVIQITDDMKRYEGQLRLVTASEAELATVTEDVFQIAQRTRSEFGATAEFYARLARSTDELGISQGQLQRVTETVNKAIQVSGATTQEAANGAIQLAQGLAAGAVRGEELNSVLENLPRLAKAIADGLGVGIGELRELGKEGKLSAEAVTSALLSQADAVDREFRQLPLRVSQAFTQLKNDVNRAIGEVDTSDLIAGVEELRSVITDPAIQQGIQAFAGAFVSASATAIQAIGDLSNNLSFFFGAKDAQEQGKLLVRQIELQQKVLDLEQKIQAVRDFGGIPGAQLESQLRDAQGELVTTTANIERLQAAIDSLNNATTSTRPIVAPLAIPDLNSAAAEDASAKAAEKRAAAIARVTDSLTFEIAQLARSSEAQAIHNALRRAGADQDSASGQRIAALVSQREDLIASQKREADAVRATKDADEERARAREALEAQQTSVLEGLDREIALYGDLSREETALFEIRRGNFAEFDASLKKQIVARSKELDLLDQYKEKEEAAAQAAKDAARELEDVGRQLGLTFTSAFEDAIVNGESFRDVIKGIEKDLIRLIARKLITEPFANAFSGIFKEGGLLSGLTPFATGGQFTIPGSGVADNVPVAFRAQPGETVTVTPKGQGSPGGGIVVNMTVNGVSDADSFNRNLGNIMTSLSAGLARAQARNA